MSWWKQFLQGLWRRSQLPVSIGLMLIAFIACYLPARRAIKVDPLVTLRCD